MKILLLTRATNLHDFKNYNKKKLKLIIPRDTRQELYCDELLKNYLRRKTEAFRASVQIARFENRRRFK